MISTLLVANRGEIAARVIRTARELGIRTVAVYGTSDRESQSVRLADRAVHIGPPASRHSYLNVPNIVQAALQTGADAIHPGYGFLSEDPDFAEICEAEGIIFVGPPPSVMQDLGNKALARRLMQDAGLPLLPGVTEPVPSAFEGQRIAQSIGYPVIIKAAAGGGGRGMTVVRDPADFTAAFDSTRAVAQAVFRDPAVYVERYLSGARHVEAQVLADHHGHCVFLGERDCSLQRRHQKVLEEGPAGYLDPGLRERIGMLAVQGARSVGFRGAGTVEFLVDDQGNFYFMEMNARIQVEHPVTEMLTGIDIVREQLLIAGGAPLGLVQDDIRPSGTAIECRINAEDPARGFTPTPGPLTEFELPGGPFTRVDTGYRKGDAVPQYYDSLIAKLIVWAPTREQALARMDRALAETSITGPGLRTTVELQRAILRHPDVRADRHDVQFLDRHLDSLLQPVPPGRVSSQSQSQSSPQSSPPPAVGVPPTPTPKGIPTMPDEFTMADLMQILTKKAGLPVAAQTDDRGAGFDDVGLDSLAFLAVQTELSERYGIVLEDDIPAHYTFGEIVDVVNAPRAEVSLERTA